jgi:hypothetical protein
LRGFDRIEIAAEAGVGTFEVDEARFPGQHVEAEPFVQQSHQTDLGGEGGTRAVAGLAWQDDPGISDGCDQPLSLSLASDAVRAGTGIDPDRVLLDPALQRIAIRGLPERRGGGKSSSEAGTARLQQPPSRDAVHAGRPIRLVVVRNSASSHGGPDGEQRVLAQDADGNRKIAEPASHTSVDDAEGHRLAERAGEGAPREL